MERMNKGDLLHIGTTYVEVHTFKGKDYIAVRDFNTTTNALSKEILELEEENKKLKERIDELEKCNLNLQERLDNKEKVNKSLREELSKYKKQYEHSMGEDNGKLTKGGYASFNEYGELMEEDTLQELRDIGKL